MANLGTVAIVGLLGVGAYAYSKHRNKKEEKKKLKPKKLPRVNNVELWTKVQELPEAPFVGLLFCDNPGGRAILETFTTIGRTFQGPSLFAISAENMSVTGVCAEGIPPAIMSAQRIRGSWRENISGEDQVEYMLPSPDEDKIRMVLGWAAGEGELPLESAEWVGEESVVWKDVDVDPAQLPVVDVKPRTQYSFPVKPPDPIAWIDAASSDEAIAEVFPAGTEDVEHREKSWAVIVNTGLLLGGEASAEVIVRVEQEGNDWAKHMLLRIRG